MATPLTDEQIYDLRGDTGDESEPFIVSAFRLERLWQRALGDYDTTVAFALRDIKAFYAKKVTATGEDQRKYNNELFEHYSTLSAEWEHRAGLDVGRIGVTSATIGQNYPQDDAEASEYEWDN